MQAVGGQCFNPMAVAVHPERMGRESFLWSRPSRVTSFDVTAGGG
jgi:hypothetical protein